MSIFKRKVRSVFAVLVILAATLLFVDVSGVAHIWLGWVAKIQLLPAILALNFVVVGVLVILTLLFGRIYCSVICPLGILQDVIARFGKMSRKNRYTYSPERKVLRYAFFVVFIAALVGGVSSLAGILEPYSSFGRIASNLFAPVYAWGNNLLAYAAERMGSYAFYPREVWVKGIGTLVVAVVTFVVLAVLAWRNGRTYCNTVCPVGTLLGLLSRWSLFAPVIDTEKCISCNKCVRNCKAACMDIPNHRIDYSRCVVCLDCIDVCPKDAVSFRLRSKAKTAAVAADKGAAAKKAAAKSEVKAADAVSRKGFITGAGLLAMSAVRAQEMKVDGGFAEIIAKKVPKRETRVVPAGAQSLHHLSAHCTGCQLCVEACPNGVLRPSGGLMTLLQPEMGFERGYCRPECVACSEVCPTGAITRITVPEKSSIQVGHAVWIRENCIVLRDDQNCDNCARHCPVEAITMVPLDAGNRHSRRIPAVNVERCIGCGACENLCPSRPFSAIYVEGHENHRTI
ncbi:MAG: 4Fe-4S binding protein [Alistipes sp.]|nr:4Fe-4S binding protein [Alistipes sp.]